MRKPKEFGPPDGDSVATAATAALARASSLQRLAVIAIVTSPIWRRHIQQALQARATVVCAPHKRWLAAPTRPRPDAIIVHLDPQVLSEIGLTVLFARLLVRYGTDAIATYCELDANTFRLLAAAIRMGIKTTWLRGHDHLGVRVLELIERRSPSQVTAAVINRLEPIPPRVRRAVTWCFEVAFDGVPTVEHLARDMAVHRRTLVNRFRAAGYPSPAAFITWSRLLLAARMLDDHRVSVSEVTRALHFASPSQYRGMLRRYADLTPSAMRRRGALASVSERFHRACTVPCSGMADVSRSDPSSSQWMTG